jgi:hypothetical protein
MNAAAEINMTDIPTRDANEAGVSQYFLAANSTAPTAVQSKMTSHGSFFVE